MRKQFQVNFRFPITYYRFGLGDNGAFRNTFPTEKNLLIRLQAHSIQQFPTVLYTFSTCTKPDC